MKIRDRIKLNDKIKYVTDASLSAKNSGVKELKISAILDDRPMNRDELEVFLGKITENVGLAVAEKHKFGSIIVIDLR